MLCGNISSLTLVNIVLKAVTDGKNQGVFSPFIDMNIKIWYYINNKYRQRNDVIYMLDIPRPSKEEVIKYLNKWDSLENYVLQENALDKLFFNIYPKNTDINDILIKCSSLNDFYSTNIFSIFPVAKHILNLNIDVRLKSGDTSLVNDIANVTIGNKKLCFYSFATKYCSHHFPTLYPIYDSFVEKVLIYFKKKDCFADFKTFDLKDYSKFKSILIKFQEFYHIQEFNLKDIDRYLWQLGKDYFPKKY